MMRSYADNAVQIAAAWRDELLAAIEVFGPRSANDLVAEGHAAAALDAPKYGLFREARAIVHRGLATLATNTDAGTAFEAYLADVVAHQPERRYYLQARNALGSQIAGAQRSGEAVSRALALRMPKTALLLVNVERAQMHVVLVDAATGTPLVVLNARPPEGAGWQVAHDAYDAALRQADTPGEDPAPGMQAAIDAVLAYYEPAFAPLLELLATRLEGYRLKIFPRFLMNRVPLHALRVRGKPLIDCCDVSYAPSLSLFLQVHQEDAAPAAGTLTILHDAARTQAYAGTMRALRSEAPESVVTVNGPTWQNFRASLEVRPASDILFACHGRFDGDNPSKSRLEVTRREFIDFAKISVDLDLRGCRSVFMGACESGLGRTLVSAEYIGLPLVFLAAGVRYVIGTLWQVTQLPAAILVAIHYTLLLDEARPVVNCLNEAARRLKSMSRDDVMAWVRRFLPEKAAEVEAQISALPDPPFAHPYYWAGFYVSGDA
jgi:CHAT domain-containing protein